jgi:hypothetical protein
MEEGLFQQGYIKKEERWGEGEQQLIISDILCFWIFNSASFAPVF